MNIVGKKKRKTFFDDFFDEIDRMFERMMESMSFFGGEIGGFGGGSWSIQITQGPDGKTTVYAELGPDVDRDKFIEYLKKKYPNAKIVVKGGKSKGKFERIKIEKEETEEREESRQKTGKFFKLFGGEKQRESELFKVIKVEKEDE